MARKWLFGCLFLLAITVAQAGSPYAVDLSAVANDGERVVLSTVDQSRPGVTLGLPADIARLDNPPGGVIITLFPDGRVGLYLRFQICSSDMFGRNLFCTRPPDYLLEARLEEVATIVDGDVARFLYDIVVPQGRLRTRLLFTSEGEFFLVVPLEAPVTQYQRVKLFVSVVSDLE